MGFEREKIATFPEDISCPHNQPSTPEEPVSFSQPGGSVSLSIRSSRLNPKPSTSKHWSVRTSQLHHCSLLVHLVQAPHWNCFPVQVDLYHTSIWELVTWCWSFCRWAKAMKLPSSDTLQVSLRQSRQSPDSCQRRSRQYMTSCKAKMSSDWVKPDTVAASGLSSTATASSLSSSFVIESVTQKSLIDLKGEKRLFNSFNFWWELFKVSNQYYTLEIHCKVSYF